MSAVPSTPVTPGRSSARHRRSSSSPRSAIAAGSLPTAFAPRAGWSAAMIMARPWSPSTDFALARLAAASVIAPGSWTRAVTIRRTRSDTGGLREFGEHFGFGGHGVGAGQLAGDVRTGGVGELDRAAGVPTGEQAVAERATEGVSGAEAVDHLDRDGRDLAGAVVVDGQDAARPLLHHRERNSVVTQRFRGLARVAGADRGLALVEVSGRDCDVAERFADPAPGLLARGPEHRPVVEVEHGDAAAAAGLQRDEGRGAAGFLAQPGDGHPEDVRGPDGV